jgi:hypothetical protein
MKLRRVLVAVVVLAACGGERSSSEPAEPAANASAPAAPAAAPPATPATPATVEVPATPPLFEFTADDDTLAFWSPDIVRFQRKGGGAPCVARQLGGDRMPTGADLEATFADPQVAETFAKNLAPHAAGIDAELTTPDGKRIRWQRACDKCMSQAPAVEKLGLMLSVVMIARRGGCP